MITFIVVYYAAHIKYIAVIFSVLWLTAARNKDEMLVCMRCKILLSVMLFNHIFGLPVFLISDQVPWIMSFFPSSCASQHHQNVVVVFVVLGLVIKFSVAFALSRIQLFSIDVLHWLVLTHKLIDWLTDWLIDWLIDWMSTVPMQQICCSPFTPNYAWLSNFVVQVSHPHSVITDHSKTFNNCNLVFTWVIQILCRSFFKIDTGLK